MTTIVTTDVTNGDTTDAAVMNSNFTAVKSSVNGNIDNANLSAGAAIAISKLASYPSDSSKFLRGDGTWTVPTSSAPGYSTTIPGSPVDGQEHILVDSITNPTYQWRFRYNSGNVTTYKWEFIGGSAMQLGSSGGITTASTTYVDLTGSQTYTIPRAGVYELIAACSITGPGGNNSAFMTVLASTSGVVASATGSVTNVNGPGDTLVASDRVTLSVANETVKCQVKNSSATNVTYGTSNDALSKPFLSIIPVRVI
jgi:hypothetical protein